MSKVLVIGTESITYKTCCRCKEIRSVIGFPKRRNGNSITIRGTCKTCFYISKRNYKRIVREKNKNICSLDLNFSKKCSRCKITKHANQFGTSRVNINGITNDCSKCRRTQWIKYKNTIKTRFSALQRSARRRELVFELPIEEFDNLTKQPCHYCGQAEELNSMNV